MKTAKISLNSIDKVKAFVNEISKFDCDFDLVSGRYVIDAKSIMGIFVAKHPVTKPNLKVIQKSEEKLAGKIDELMEEALRTTEVIEIQ